MAPISPGHIHYSYDIVTPHFPASPHHTYPYFLHRIYPAFRTPNTNLLREASAILLAYSNSGARMVIWTRELPVINRVHPSSSFTRKIAPPEIPVAPPVPVLQRRGANIPVCPGHLFRYGRLSLPDPRRDRLDVLGTLIGFSIIAAFADQYVYFRSLYIEKWVSISSWGHGLVEVVMLIYCRCS